MGRGTDGGKTLNGMNIYHTKKLLNNWTMNY